MRLKNWIRKWLGWDEIEFRLGLIKQALYDLKPKPLTWLSPWPKVDRPFTPLSPALFDAQFEQWKRLRDKQEAILDAPPKFKKKPYTILNLTDEEAIDKLIKKEGSKDRPIEQGDVIGPQQFVSMSGVRPAATAGWNNKR